MGTAYLLSGAVNVSGRLPSPTGYLLKNTQGFMWLVLLRAEAVRVP